MKKIIILAVLAAMCQGVFLFAQERPTSEESEFYYYSVPIEKVYAYRLGYMVVYRRNSNLLGRTYIPHTWFTRAGDSAKGELVMLGSGKEWPTMTVYYLNGEFSHVRLRLRKEWAHESWGIVPLSMNLDEYFENVEEIKMEF